MEIDMKKFALNAAVMSALMGKNLLPKKSEAAPKKPWQTRPDYLRKPTICKNPKIANHVNMMFNKNYGEKFGYVKTDFT
jgi:hypothetical protein